jgi:hypothetical protein
MGEVPRESGTDAVEVRSALDDTLRAEPSVDPPDPAAAARALPSQDRYRLGAELGRGGMGRVVEAFDLQLGRTVALKEVLPRGGPGIARRFLREVQLTARLEHPSIIPLYDSGTTVDGRPFYVMRRVTGRPLDQLLARAIDLGERLTQLPALLAAIDAVAHAHRRGVIHRDLKPANILVGELGETVVIDWGLAKVIGEDDEAPGTVIAIADEGLRTQIGAVFGTPGFMAPEQARGEALDPRGDVYALGAILYQLLAAAPPHSGTSATEVIANTGSREVTPVSVVAPGAPPELVAIVGKALAFDPAGRYADAGALGEDVRRFLAGQLVAAHRYTPRQRVARFARRHRAPLLVTAFAMVAVAVLAWFSVHRIVRERDAANEAREQAAEGRAAAERAAAELRRSADQLVVLQAQGLLDGNPTHAAAVLKEVPETSDRIGSARAVAQAAAVRGIAWTMPTPDLVTVIAELSADARFLLQVSRDGVVRIWDLDRRRLVIAQPYPHGSRAVWAGNLVLVIADKAAPQLLDPFTGTSAGTSQPLAIGPIRWAVATTSGDRVAYLDEHGAANLLDVASRTAQPLWIGHQPGHIAIASDGRWIALADKTTVAVVDPAGRELTSHPGEAADLIRSRFDELAYQTRDKVVRCTLQPQPVWSEIDLAPAAPPAPGRGRAPADAAPPVFPLQIVFRGHELDVLMSSLAVMAWDGQRLRQRTKLDGLNFMLVEAAHDLLVAPGLDGKLRFWNDLVAGALHLPIPVAYNRVLARPGSSRLVAIGSGVIAGFELTDLVPELIDQTAARAPATLATFVDDDTVMLWNQPGGDWQWYDLQTRASKPFHYEAIGMPLIMDVDASDGRVALREIIASGPAGPADNDTSLVVIRKGTAEQHRLARGPAVWARLLPRGAAVFGVGDGRVLGTTTYGAPPRELVKLEGDVEGAVALGATGFAAVSSKGELVRGDLATGELRRARVDPGASWAIAADRAGRVLVAEDRRLLVWDRDVAPLARLDQPIARIEPIDGGALIELADHSMVRTSLAAGAPVTLVMPAASQSPLVSRDGRLVIGRAVNDQAVVFETATQATWTLPAYYASFQLMTISPSTRRFVQAGFGRLALWTLPLAPPELKPWLDERTNAATDRDHQLVWR